MGNSVTTKIGDSLSCFRDHQNTEAFSRGMASGRDLDDQVLQAMDHAIEDN